MGKILLDRSVTGVEHYVEVNGDELVTAEFTPTSVDKIVIDDVKARGDLAQNARSGMRHAASIPINTYMGWRKEWAQTASDTYTWKTFLAMKLNSSDYKFLRVNGKRL